MVSVPFRSLTRSANAGLLSGFEQTNRRNGSLSSINQSGLPTPSDEFLAVNDSSILLHREQHIEWQAVLLVAPCVRFGYHVHTSNGHTGSDLV
jgi:hypothetical protein